ncbi:MAG: hypothetical protein HY696_08130 [Deltaproteobacteria bacterium]|nr:hypothetical protein [Deltaproteobacteria bacterium]
MKSYCTTVVVALVVWWCARGIGLPVDPFLVMVLLMALDAPNHRWALGVVCTVGVVAESLLLLPFGSLSSAYLFTYAVVGGAVRRLHVRSIAPRALWCAVGAALAGVWQQWIYAGAVAWHWALLGDMAWHVAVTLTLSWLVTRWLIPQHAYEFPA